MALKLMYITKDPRVAQIAEAEGVDRIFVDLEYIGKAERQQKMNSVQNHHTPGNVATIKKAVSRAKVLARVNPIHDGGRVYTSSEEEINAVIEAGADIVMLPYFRTTEEVHRFLNAVGGRARTMHLLETAEAEAAIDEILSIPGIDEIHIGINDLCLSQGKKFLFELLADGTVERLCRKCKAAGIPYGFGGIARIGKGILPAEYVIKEHYRLGSSFAILSRSFCDAMLLTDYEEIARRFHKGVGNIRALEAECAAELTKEDSYFEDNRQELIRRVQSIVEGMQ